MKYSWNEKSSDYTQYKLGYDGDPFNLYCSIVIGIILAQLLTLISHSGNYQHIIFYWVWKNEDFNA
jgi:hypothetical protein